MQFGNAFLEWFGRSRIDISAEQETGGRPANELYLTRISCTWELGFVTEISEIAISN